MLVLWGGAQGATFLSLGPALRWHAARRLQSEVRIVSLMLHTVYEAQPLEGPKPGGSEKGNTLQAWGTKG